MCLRPLHLLLHSDVPAEISHQCLQFARAGGGADNKCVNDQTDQIQMSLILKGWFT